MNCTSTSNSPTLAGVSGALVCAVLACATWATQAAEPDNGAQKPATVAPPKAAASSPAVTPAVARTPVATPSTTGRPANGPAAGRKPTKAELERQRAAAAAREAEVNRIEAAFDKAQQAGDIEAAAQSLAELKLVLPESQFAYMRRAAWLAQVSGDTDEARRWYGRILARLPDDLNAQLNLALMDAREGMRAQALERVRSLKFLYPGATSVDRVLDLLERG